MATMTIAPPRGEFALRICAGCGQQINDGHHAHDGRLSPVYDVPAVPQTQYDDMRRDRDRLIGEIEDYFLWEPGRRGHAAAARRLREALNA